MYKGINIQGISLENDDKAAEFVDYYMKKAKVLNGFFKINKMQDDHEDLQIISMYIAIQLAMNMIKREELEGIMEAIYEIEEALRPRFGSEND